jgi:transposase
MEETTLELFFKDGPLAGKSKGLKVIAEELGYDLPEKIKLKEIKELLKDHPAFNSETKLESLAEKYNKKIVYCPKYHCELNPIEGLWCFMKWNIRAHTDQRYQTMLNLIDESRTCFKQKELNKKLIRRFWRCLIAYQQGLSYIEVLRIYFSGKSKEKIESHRKITNSLAE